MADVDFSLLRVLLVEDNDFVRFLVDKYLKDIGFSDVMLATNGREGIEKLAEKPDVIICDIQMEPMNGFEFLEHLRKAETPGQHLPVLFLTSNAEADYVRRALDLNVSAYLLKPISPKELKKKLSELLRREMVA
jgi:two-component system chemotaxis response regulator CheY